MSVIRTTKDFERVKSILEMVSLIEERIRKDKNKNFYPLIISDYYEIIKELMTALLICDGKKTLSHIELVQYVKKNYSELSEREVFLIDRLRVLRNKVAYEGGKAPPEYLENNEGNFIVIIKKLKSLISERTKR